MSDYTIRLCQPDEVEASWAVEKSVWAPFNWEADGSVGVDYDPELHLVAFDQEGKMVATIDACGFDWDGDPDHLPAGGWTEVVLRARDGFSQQPPYACALGASITSEARSGGLSGQLLAALRDQAFSLGYRALVAPVRPAARWRMIDLTIAEYADVRLPDGRHFDPWVRVHENLGGRIIGSCEASAYFEGEREDWERWAGMRLPSNGLVIIDHATGWLEMVDGFGVLAEDSIWLLHEPAQPKI